MAPAGKIASGDVNHLTGNVSASFSGLLASTTVAHLHCCTAAPFAGVLGVATPTPTFPGFPAGVTAGTYNIILDLTLDASWSAAFRIANGGAAGAEAAFVAGLETGKAYFNVHTTQFPGGEIRGFFQRVPEPATTVLLALGVLAFKKTSNLSSRRSGLPQEAAVQVESCSGPHAAE
jgi:hypothetical protein